MSGSCRREGFSVKEIGEISTARQWRDATGVMKKPTPEQEPGNGMDPNALALFGLLAFVLALMALGNPLPFLELLHLLEAHINEEGVIAAFALFLVFLQQLQKK